MANAKLVAQALSGHRYREGWLVCCPVTTHGRGRGDQNPSLSVTDNASGSLVVHCHAGCDWQDVRDALDNKGLLPPRAEEISSTHPQQSLTKHDALTSQQKLDHVHTIWRDAKPSTGTPVDRYLQALGITIPTPGTIKFSWLRHTPTNQTLPTMVAAIQNSTAEVIGISRTYLNPSGWDKAHVTTPRMLLGEIAGGAVRLSPAEDTVTLAEGIEDGLALTQITDTCVWATLGTSGFTNIELPSQIKRVILAPDNDEAGRSVINQSAERLYKRGLEVRVALPSPNKDWCDMLPDYEERAAICEFDGEVSKEIAERMAWAEVRGDPSWA